MMSDLPEWVLRRAERCKDMGREGQDPKTDAPFQEVIDPIDEAGAESFPASDPPGWVPLHPGSPVPAPEKGRAGRTSSDRRRRRRIDDLPAAEDDR